MTADGAAEGEFAIGLGVADIFQHRQDHFPAFCRRQIIINNVISKHGVDTGLPQQVHPPVAFGTEFKSLDIEFQVVERLFLVLLILSDQIGQSTAGRFKAAGVFQHPVSLEPARLGRLHRPVRIPGKGFRQLNIRRIFRQAVRGTKQTVQVCRPGLGGGTDGRDHLFIKEKTGMILPDVFQIGVVFQQPGTIGGKAANACQHQQKRKDPFHFILLL